MTNPHAVSEYSVAEEAVGSVVKGYCEAWNTHDMKALAELFVDDAHWINIVGMHWPGKPAVQQRHPDWLILDTATTSRNRGIERVTHAQDNRITLESNTLASPPPCLGSPVLCRSD